MSRVRRGGAAIEFAMTLPIMVVLLLGTIEYGWYYSRLAWVNTVAREAVRHAAAGEVDTAQDLAEDTALTLLEDTLGTSCDEAGCRTSSNVVSAGAMQVLTLTVALDYEQLTGVLPDGSSMLSFAVPETLGATAAMPLTEDF